MGSQIASLRLAGGQYRLISGGQMAGRLTPPEMPAKEAEQEAPITARHAPAALCLAGVEALFARLFHLFMRAMERRLTAAKKAGR